MIRYFVEDRMRNPAIIITTYLTLIVVASIGPVLAVPAVAQDQFILGPRQLEEDKSGAGAVLCSWMVLVAVRAQAAACGLSRQPIDDAMDEAIVAIDEFILANSSLHPTRNMIESFKRDWSQRARSGPQYCEDPELRRDRSDNEEPARIRARVKALLAIPREPVAEPCH
jgi:hypothetical protein